ncbi:AAA family ATPase [Cereibacter sphaeroides]|uniref:AAA family ATPase n=2 Tax=Cereibacter sphaeroides TaxID=1063 RepID=A0AAX1UEC2_CERSP|nr:AAA family ATPase [Cereibacter sphaeroides]
MLRGKAFANWQEALMKRVMIVGQPGSGKSTLAREVGSRTGLPVFHIDHIHWTSGWIERSREEKTRLCQEVHAREEWIFEGGHSATWPERLARCDTLIWLDVPIHVRLWRVFLRSLQYRGRTRPDLPDGCPEQFDWSFYRWIWNTRISSRAQIERLVAGAPGDKVIIRLQSVSEITMFLTRLPESSGTLSSCRAQPLVPRR